MKKLVAGILVVALMLTLGSAFAQSYTFELYDPYTKGDSFEQVLEETITKKVFDTLGTVADIKDAWIKFRSANGLGSGHECILYKDEGYLNSCDDYKVRTRTFAAIDIKAILRIVYNSEPATASAASVAKEVSKDGKVTIYAAPSKSSTKLASAVSYYDCKILGTMVVDGATWTNVDYDKDDVAGWILTK